MNTRFLRLIDINSLKTMGRFISPHLISSAKYKQVEAIKDKAALVSVDKEEEYHIIVNSDHYVQNPSLQMSLTMITPVQATILQIILIIHPQLILVVKY
ncbi:uncharacterized protein ARMOST_06510 [Armillaria ostoyae]|uniref:Uncharacterized protein n=1 Tax=Armillaria ostoyae TaxID=47428 RepID=A0A284R362_ARMOS|nr:uncharacterized protein ARMOST_06510 [Armillaria ostoyae]